MNITKIFLTLKKKGLHKFAPIPPLDENYLVCELWDKIIPTWRNRPRKEESSIEDQSKIVERVKKFSSAPSLKKGEDFITEQEIDFISIERLMRKKKGSWWQLPKDLKIDNNGP